MGNNISKKPTGFILRLVRTFKTISHHSRRQQST